MAYIERNCHVMFCHISYLRELTTKKSVHDETSHRMSRLRITRTAKQVHDIVLIFRYFRLKSIRKVKFSAIRHNDEISVFVIISADSCESTRFAIISLKWVTTKIVYCEKHRLLFKVANLCAKPMNQPFDLWFTAACHELQFLTCSPSKRRQK